VLARLWELAWIHTQATCSSHFTFSCRVAKCERSAHDGTARKNCGSWSLIWRLTHGRRNRRANGCSVKPEGTRIGRHTTNVTRCSAQEPKRCCLRVLRAACFCARCVTRGAAVVSGSRARQLMCTVYVNRAANRAARGAGTTTAMMQGRPATNSTADWPGQSLARATPDASGLRARQALQEVPEKFGYYCTRRGARLPAPRLEHRDARCVSAVNCCTLPRPPLPYPLLRCCSPESPPRSATSGTTPHPRPHSPPSPLPPPAKCLSRPTYIQDPPARIVPFFCLASTFHCAHDDAASSHSPTQHPHRAPMSHPC
jgi:hypothetical protein